MSPSQGARLKFDSNNCLCTSSLGNFMRNPVIDHLDHIKTECPNADHIHDNGFFIGNDSVDLKSKIESVGRLIKDLV